MSIFIPYNLRNLHTGHYSNYLFLSNYSSKHSEVISIRLRHTVNLLIHYVTILTLTEFGQT